jgi:hypothetical protein
LDSYTWETNYTVIIEHASNFVFRSGLGNGTNNLSPTNLVGFRIAPDASANIQYDLITGGATTATYDSGLVYDSTATSYNFRMRSDGSIIYFSVSKNGAAASTEKTLCPSGCDMTASLPTFATTPFFRIVHGSTNDGVLKRVYLDRFSMSVSGLVR